MGLRSLPWCTCADGWCSALAATALGGHTNIPNGRGSLPSYCHSSLSLVVTMWWPKSLYSPLPSFPLCSDSRSVAWGVPGRFHIRLSLHLEHGHPRAGGFRPFTSSAPLTKGEDLRGCLGNWGCRDLRRCQAPGSRRLGTCRGLACPAFARLPGLVLCPGRKGHRPRRPSRPCRSAEKSGHTERPAGRLRVA